MAGRFQHKVGGQLLLTVTKLHHGCSERADQNHFPEDSRSDAKVRSADVEEASLLYCRLASDTEAEMSSMKQVARPGYPSFSFPELWVG